MKFTDKTGKKIDSQPKLVVSPKVDQFKKPAPPIKKLKKA
jgi:hypothetical protein